MQTSKMALKRWTLAPVTIFHSDRSSQYTSESVIRLLQENKIQQSFPVSVSRATISRVRASSLTLKKKLFLGGTLKHGAKHVKPAFLILRGFITPVGYQKRLEYLSPL